jgi:hypothetical protein
LGMMVAGTDISLDSLREQALGMRHGGITQHRRQQSHFIGESADGRRCPTTLVPNPRRVASTPLEPAGYLTINHWKADDGELGCVSASWTGITRSWSTHPREYS